MNTATSNKKLAIIEALSVLNTDTTEGQRVFACCFLEAFYLEFLNDFLSIGRYAEYWDLDEELTEQAIAVGRRYNRCRETDITV